jgi:hypothetical protein
VSRTGLLWTVVEVSVVKLVDLGYLVYATTSEIVLVELRYGLNHLMKSVHTPGGLEDG